MVREKLHEKKEVCSIRQLANGPLKGQIKRKANVAFSSILFIFLTFVSSPDSSYDETTPAVRRETSHETNLVWVSHSGTSDCFLQQVTFRACFVFVVALNVIWECQI